MPPTDLRALVAHPRFRWMPGMLVLWSVDAEPHRTRLTGARPPAVLLSGDPVPDLTDPATIGCLEALVLAAYGGAVTLRRGLEAWSIEAWGRGGIWTGTDDYADGLARALMAAP